MLTTTYPIPQNSLMPPPADEQLSQAYRAAQVEAAGLTARAASSCSVGGPIQATPTADAISVESGAGAIITDDDIATAPVVTDASLQNAFQQSQTVAPAVSATYARLGGRRFRQMRAFGQRSGGGGQFAGGGNSAQFAGPGSGAQFGAPGSNVAPPGTAGSLASGAGAPIDWTSMMSYSPEPGTGEAWDPPGSLQPAANSGFPAGSGGTGGQGPGGVATSNPYSPVSNFPGTPWGQPSTSGPGRCCNPGGWAGLSWWAKLLIVGGGAIVVVYKAAEGR
jgi:hypothetical protein